MAKPGVLKQLNWASATPAVVELVFASFLANDLPEAIMANQKTVKLGEIHALLEQDDRFGEHGVKPPSLSTLGTWLSNGERAWKAYPKARTWDSCQRMLHARLLHGGVEIAVQQEEALAPVLFAMQALATFFLAAFISLVLQRWSTLRLNAVGNVYGAASNLCTLAGHVWAGTDSHSRAMRKRTLRYILLAFSLMFAEARREDDLQIYVDAAMLTREERFVLDALPRKAQAVAGWLLRHFHMDKFSKTASVQSETERKLLLEQIFRLRGMIADCHMYVGVQIPLPYTAFITLIVKATMLVIALDAALDVVISHDEGDWVRIICQTVRVCLWSIFYQACLDLHTVLSNPFGYDAADFPQSDYFFSMAGSCYAQLESETMIAEHVAALGKAGVNSPAVSAELAMMAAEDDDGVDDDGEVDLQQVKALYAKGKIDGVSMHRIQEALRQTNSPQKRKGKRALPTFPRMAMR
ncbi:hypothetical protein KFE25_008472 [Diacronema lutheri]|uniref:Bestrophin homolog n=1 Tax=Diacronema lutheri TaxID=2081491 RepID=A0A8J6C626_DIALT|nr:hypothetical protein KFE25_008472 [Diacronema lutheri]